MQLVTYREYVAVDRRMGSFVNRLIVGILKNTMHNSSRREFLKQSLGLGALALAAAPLCDSLLFGAEKPGSKMKIGLVTYLWGQDWDLPTLLANCEKAKVLGVELRTEHKHGVEPKLNDAERKEVRKRFADSPVAFIGPGTNECFDSPDPAKLAQSIEKAKSFVKLSRDCGGSGVKVKPNNFHAEVPHEKTIEQIGRSLNVLGSFAADYGQSIRLEVHGSCAELPNIKQIMDVVTEKNVGVCWNCNDEDLHGGGLEYNFNLVKNRFGDYRARTRVEHRQLSLSGIDESIRENRLSRLDPAGMPHQSQRPRGRDDRAA